MSLLTALIVKKVTFWLTFTLKKRPRPYLKGF